ncbi:MAG: ATP phosphoribosyltransferase regulatory subunit [Myxococcales bacterium]
MPASLQHPLPGGMRDLLPEEAAQRRALAQNILRVFGVHGYALVTLPAFEFAEVLERGLGVLDPADVLRFVEPESGEVAALGPDMTPQIARLIATRLGDRPAPYRLCYEGTVLRRRSGRARKHRQIAQVGVELAGVGEPEGDLELLEVAARALVATGLERFTIDLGDAGIVRSLLPASPASIEPGAVLRALSRKDDAELSELVRGFEHADALVRLTALHGGRDAALEGVRLLADTPAASSARELLELFDAATARGFGGHLVVDLGEVRGFAYYTGPIFHVFAQGPGEAIGSGGRYDELLGRFGAPMAAAGFALDLDRLVWALQAAGRLAAKEHGVVAVAASDTRVATLRAAGVRTSVVASSDRAWEYARGWGYSHVLEGGHLVEVTTGKSFPADAGPDMDCILDWFGRKGA